MCLWLVLPDGGNLGTSHILMGIGLESGGRGISSAPRFLGFPSLPLGLRRFRPSLTQAPFNLDHSRLGPLSKTYRETVANGHELFFPETKPRALPSLSIPLLHTCAQFFLDNVATKATSGHSEAQTHTKSSG